MSQDGSTHTSRNLHEPPAISDRRQCVSMMQNRGERRQGMASLRTITGADAGRFYGIEI